MCTIAEGDSLPSEAIHNRPVPAKRYPVLIGIGAAVARRPLPQHREYGSVHGGSMQPYAGYADITQYATGANYNYNSLQVQIRKEFRGGGLINAAYTWSKSLTNASSWNEVPMDSYCVWIEPEVRLTKWTDRNFGVRGSAVRSNLNQIELLLGVIF